MSTRRAAPRLLGLVLVVVAFGLVGVLAGLLWPQLVDPVMVTRTGAGTATGEVDLSERFDNDGWYSVLAAGLGLLLGVLLTLWLRRRREPEVPALVAVLVGAALAAWLMARVGTAVGPSDPVTVLADAEIGANAPDRVRVSAGAAYLVWPIAAVAGALAVLWRPSRDPT